MAPAAAPAAADALANGHLEGQSAQQLANGNLEHSQAQASKKLSASEKRRQRRKESKKRAVFEYVTVDFAARQLPALLCAAQIRFLLSRRGTPSTSTAPEAAQVIPQTASALS